jgi:acetyl esterase/lipase
MLYHGKLNYYILNKLILLIIFTIFISNASFSQQYCIPGRFDTTYAFSPLDIDTLGAITYGKNVNFLGDTTILKYIIAYPKFSADPLSKRPFILLIHGGGFIDGSMYDMKPVMLDFAMRGYVCASIDYRIGWNTGGNPLECTGDGYSLAQAIYRAMQDTKAAFRYFAAKANIYKIDTAYFFSGGISAGAVLSLMITYATQNNVLAQYPNLVTELGPLNRATNRYRNQFGIKGIISSSGGLFDTAYIRRPNAVPTLMFHGTADINVPYGTGYAYSCLNYVRTEGSNEITKRFRTISKSFELDYVPGGGHENFYPLEYIQRRAILFLKRTLCNQPRQVIIENYTTLLDTSLRIITPVVTENEIAPDEYVLNQNYPNPFNPVTVIKYSIPKTELVKLTVYDILGKEIETLVNEVKNPGEYRVDFNASSYTNGVYFYKLTTGNFSQTKKMLFVK